MSRQTDKGGWSGDSGLGESWAQFDALPRGVKRLYWHAPYNYTALSAFRRYQRGGDMRAAVDRQRLAMARDVARESKRLYGEA